MKTGSRGLVCTTSTFGNTLIETRTVISSSRQKIAEFSVVVTNFG
jgi:hypothetical protein